MATTTTNDANTISLKLLVNKCTNKVLFAEAGKDFVDFILSLLTMPIGSIVEILKMNEMVGSLGKLYGSFQRLSYTYMQPNADKNVLLHPCHKLSSSQNLLRIQAKDISNSPSTPICYYRCGYSSSHDYISTTRDTQCPYCRYPMSTSMKLIATGGNAKNNENVAKSDGFVKEVVTYMIMDDLVFSPMSTISSITMISKLGVRDIGSLEEKTVTVGFDEGLKLLKASLQSSTVLTDVFLK